MDADQRGPVNRRTRPDLALRQPRLILDKVNLDVRPGEIVTIIGPNGAGKSSLVRVLLGLQKPSSGEIVRKPGLRVGYVPQRFPLTPNVPLDVRRLLVLTHRASEAEIDAALAETGILHLKTAAVAALVRRRNATGACWRAPCCASRELLVLDEPVQAVDFIGETKLYALIGEIRRKHGCGILMVSHDLHMVMADSDRVICLNAHICCEGRPESIQQDPEFARLFGRGGEPDHRRLYASSRP